MQKTMTAVWPPVIPRALQTLLLCFVLALAASVRGQPQSDSHFISIDCGSDRDYMDSNTHIAYSSDAGYIDTGVNKRVAPDYKMGNLRRFYYDLRSFPNGTRNCYTVSPLQRGKKYLVRACFTYGNYDGRNQPPEFDLYVGVNFWQTVFANSTDVEIMVLIPDDFVHVCLVNTGAGTPFISALELRPLADSMYPFVNASQSLVLFGNRQNYGGNADVQIRYPDDPYDRVWFTARNGNGWLPVSAEGTQVKTDLKNRFLVPSAVMRTAVTTASLDAGLKVTVTGSPRERLYLIMHFAELRQLGANESNAFDVYVNGVLTYPGYAPAYLQTWELFTTEPGSEGESATYSLVATANSTVTPILNAHEVHYLRRRSLLLPTDNRDAHAMLSIKGLYKVGKNWEGDPCAPKEFMWDDLNCSSLSDASTIIPRIISLRQCMSQLIERGKDAFSFEKGNLSSSGLTGGIPDSIANLTALKSLDLSYNNITGEIPGFLGMLPALLFLNLSSNQLSGTVPQALVKKSQDGSLLLSVNGNPNLCEKDVGSCEVAVKKKNILIPIIIAASASLLLLFVLAILIWLVKRTRKPGAPQINPQDISANQLRLDVGNLQPESCQIFTFPEIADITNNFQRKIGRGGFGTVYHGCLPDGAQVAVKMLSKSSPQGAKQFLAEAHVLTRVHHRNLVSFLGYCDDVNNLALVYEFMPQGSLDKYLSGNSDHATVLSWRSRLRIALDIAQGLDYLHSGCNPPIVHRDVKATNILLLDNNINMGAKLADFGLSKVFADPDATHVTTAVAGTIGYLDPEYYRSYRLNEKSDVYSFGVVLLELVTGRPPIISKGLQEKIHIAEWVRSRLDTGDIDSIADHKMRGEYDVNAVWKAVEVAKECTESSSAERPTMSEVVTRLKQGCCSSTSETRAGGDSTSLYYLGMQSSTEMSPSTSFGPSAR